MTRSPTWPRAYRGTASARPSRGRCASPKRLRTRCARTSPPGKPRWPPTWVASPSAGSGGRRDGSRRALVAHGRGRGLPRHLGPLAPAGRASPRARARRVAAHPARGRGLRPARPGPAREGRGGQRGCGAPPRPAPRARRRRVPGARPRRRCRGRRRAAGRRRLAPARGAAIWGARRGYRGRRGGRGGAPLAARMRQDSERNRAMVRVGRRWPRPDVAYAACSTVHTSSHRFWKRRR